MTTPLKSVSREVREEALRKARSGYAERYFQLREELDNLKTAIRQVDAQLIAMDGLELPTETEDAPE